MKEISFTVEGEPASKANSRKIVKHAGTGRPMVIKSKKARDYEEAFRWQVRALDVLIEDDVSVTATIYYRTRRPDLDESVILDCMQGLIYKNDRQVKEKHIYHALDKERPRAEITVRVLK